MVAMPAAPSQSNAVAVLQEGTQQWSPQDPSAGSALCLPQHCQEAWPAAWGTAEPDFARFFPRPCDGSVYPRSHTMGCCMHRCWQGAAAGPSLPAGGYGTASAGIQAPHFSPSTQKCCRAASRPQQAAEAPKTAGTTSHRHCALLWPRLCAGGRGEAARPPECLGCQLGSGKVRQVIQLISLGLWE